MNNAVLQALCESVGRRLTSRTCVVRFREPAWKGSDGTACRRDNKAVIDIRPGMTSERFLFVLLHELGHVKTLWGAWVVKVPDYAPGSLEMPAAYITPSESVSFRESQANELAGVWLKYAEENAGKYEGTWLESRLKALEHYLEPELQEILDRAVRIGVERALKNVPANRER